MIAFITQCRQDEFERLRISGGVRKTADGIAAVYSFVADQDVAVVILQTVG